MEFKNKVIVITGGFAGTGKVIVNKLRNLGAKVYSLDYKYSGVKINKNFITYKIDLSNFSEIKKFVNFLTLKENKIDTLINNAGISTSFDKKKIFEYWNKTLNTNLSSAFFLSTLLVKLLKRSKYPSIVNIGSIASKIAMSNNQAYNCSKAGIVSLTYSQAMDYKNLKIRSNCISPGYVKTTMTKKSFLNKKKYNERVKRMIIENYGESLDIAEMALFLSSKKSKYINAENIVIDGGLTKKGI